MKNSKVLSGFLLLLCMACSNVKETPKGFKYTLVKRGDGIAVKPGKFLIMSMFYKDGKDSIWNDTRKTEFPMVVPIQDTTAINKENGIDGLFRYLTKGDSVTFSLTAQELYEKTFHQRLPLKIDPKSKFTFNMRVNDVYDSAQVMKMQDSLMSKAQNAQFTKDALAIEAYLAANKIAALRDSSGLYYIITKEGHGKRPTLGQSVVFNYAGKLMETGVEFDKSAAPVTMPLRRLIKGWQIGLPLLNTGTKATLFIPSSLAWGQRGGGTMIPPNANVIFDIELIDIKD